MSALPQIVLRPRKLYGPSAHDGHYRLVRGARRQDGKKGRSLALLDQIGIKKRKRWVMVRISDQGHAELMSRASRLGVHAAALAVYYLECDLRGRRP